MPSLLRTWDVSSRSFTIISYIVVTLPPSQPLSKLPKLLRHLFSPWSFADPNQGSSTILVNLSPAIAYLLGTPTPKHFHSLLRLPKPVWYLLKPRTLSRLHWGYLIQLSQFLEAYIYPYFTTCSPLNFLQLFLSDRLFSNLWHSPSPITLAIPPSTSDNPPHEPYPNIPVSFPTLPMHPYERGFLGMAPLQFSYYSLDAAIPPIPKSVP